MSPAREELVLFALVLLSLGLFAWGMLELTWTRAGRAAAGAALPHSPRRRYPARTAAAEQPPVPTVVPPLKVAPPADSPRMSLSELLDQIDYLADLPLRALVLLRRADAELANAPADTARADTLHRRLGVARIDVGCRLVAAGMAEQALVPLSQAVRGNGLAPEDLQRARETLVAALGTITEQRAQTIRRIAQEGNQTSAVGHAERLAALLRGALDNGLTESELSGALATAQRLFAHLGVRRMVRAR
ncbi:MAG: hypothetical protein FJZ38_19810 [Candidatus Rokubacteria bacterium]|nr:hypothetical protein [Candidatus Rokubacteria bacterium]